MTYFMYKGISFPVVDYSLETLSYVENEFQLLDDDIVNVVYPKSGTHWMQEILGLIWHDGNPSWVQSLPVWERSPWIETDEGLKAALKYPSPRLLASHLPSHIFPKSFLHSKAKVIYTLRSPKDVLVSFYHFSKAFKGLKDPGTMEEFMEEFLSGNLPYGSWFDYVKGWVEMKDRPNVFFNTYEELQEDLRGSVERICCFLGKELNSQQIDSVVDNASFQKMKDNKMSNFSLVPESHFDHKKGKLMRKGISGDWKNHLTVAQSERFDRVYQEKMQGAKIPFPWD
ncbi:sulfotransferase 2B1-like [Rhineura floridana]|uniref:sulfotransferase 2B1-like n=1 Tax=Rhineura floridana TaxID=261503 RepID=UPI002AC84C7D|nr:sulfotransferase 2B1-like [Rhineura floridana]XP_061453044.1 sulfotransferase 2B1-like [Rhineura floridana]XP_061453091.1 sulfotransferase 2B1-like [Rhineura floridana]XP_061453092.1 sulfotransferase 2B1-like [Rhineura floridana]